MRWQLSSVIQDTLKKGLPYLEMQKNNPTISNRWNIKNLIHLEKMTCFVCLHSLFSSYPRSWAGMGVSLMGWATWTCSAVVSSWGRSLWLSRYGHGHKIKLLWLVPNWTWFETRFKNNRFRACGKPKSVAFRTLAKRLYVLVPLPSLMS